MAITYDDGPYIYTQQVLDQVEAYKAKATFFITGNNLGKGSIDENWAGVISNMYAAGHQIASHTWSHQNLDQITHEQRVEQMVKNEMALRNIIGKYPTYMRPPYSACYSASCQNDMKALGYVVTSFDLDTDDYNQLTKEKIQVAKDNFKSGIDSAGADGDRLSISHDIHELTALNLTGYMLDYVYRNGWTAVTVGECMNDPVENWYRDSTPGVKPSATPSSSVPVPTPTGTTSVDGMCGGASGQSCIGFIGPAGLGECCSSSGWCGSTDAYCGTGCNPLFGKCGPQPSIIPSVSASTTSAAPLPTVSLTTSTDGACGTVAGKTCKGFTLEGVQAECCSQYNSCGASDAYCGQGCNPLYGNCGSSGSSSSASASISASASASASASSSIPVSQSESVSSSGSASSAPSPASSSAIISPTASVNSSASINHSSSVAASSSASASRSDVSVSQSASSTIMHSSSESASASVSKQESSSISSTHSSSDSASASTHESSSTVAQSSPASASASASKQEFSSISESKTSSASIHVSTFESAPATVTLSASISKHDVTSSTYPTSSPDVHSTHAPNVASTVTPIASSTPASISKDNVYPSSSPSATYPNEQTTTPVKPSSTMSTIVRPSSTPCDDDKATEPTPAGPPVSNDGKCGKGNGGQTCAGYKNPFGQSVECCCKESGRCSTDSWACGVGCDNSFGKCNSY